MFHTTSTDFIKMERGIQTLSSPPLKSFLLPCRSRPAYRGAAVGRQRHLFLQSGHRRRPGGKERGPAGAPCAW